MRAHDQAREVESARLAMRRKSYDPVASATASSWSTESYGREAHFPQMAPCYTMYSARPQQAVVSPRQVALDKSPLATLPTPPPSSRPGTNNSPRAAQQQPRASTALPGMRPNGQASPAAVWMNSAWMNAPANAASAPLPLKFDMSYPIGPALERTPPPPPPYGGLPYVDEQLRKLRQENRELQSEVREVNDLLNFEREAHHSAHGQWATNREQGLQQAAAARQRQRRLRRGMIALAAAGADHHARARRSLLLRAAGARLQRPRVTAYFANWRRTVARAAERAAREAEIRQQEERASAEQARAPSSSIGGFPARAQRGDPPMPPMPQCPNAPMPNAQCPMPQCPMPNAQCPVSNALCPPSTNVLRHACLFAQAIGLMREEHARQLAAAAEAQRAALERLRAELTGAAGAEVESREATERERRVEALAGKAMRRIQNAGIIAGWTAWQGQWEEAARQKRMLSAAGARLARPQLAAAVAHWRQDWETEGKVAVAQERRAERSAHAAEVHQFKEEGTALRLAGLAAEDDRVAQRAKLAAATEEQRATAQALAAEQAET